MGAVVPPEAARARVAVVPSEAARARVTVTVNTSARAMVGASIATMDNGSRHREPVYPVLLETIAHRYQIVRTATRFLTAEPYFMLFNVLHASQFS